VCGFFFSSRRRHTRWPRDWSSDVCSSDLEREASYAAALASNGWSGSFWRVAELGLPPLAVLQARRAVIWQVGLEQYPPFNASAQIGRASCRERVESLVVAGA